MPRKSGGAQAARVGLLVLVAVAVLAFGVFLIGDQNNLFSRKNRYYIDFQSAGGLKQGNPVQLNGVDVGAVDRVILPTDPARKLIRVWITVDRAFAGRVRTDSRARIKTLGLLGDKFVEITSGSPGFPIVPSDGKVQAAPATNVDAILSSGEDVMDNVVTISHQLTNILARMERGEGLLGQLTSNTPDSLRMRRSLVGTFESFERIASTVENGDGPLPRLLNDRELADRLARAVVSLEAVTASVQNGPGLLPGLLNDPATRQSFDTTLATLNQVARDLQAFTADLESSEALLPRLVKDEQYGREITEEVRQFVERLNTVSERLISGEGTAAKLINDPQIYRAVNDILIGVNESWMLRWLIRNRQKAGIEKRYDDAGGPPRSEAAEPAPDPSRSHPEPDPSQQPPAPRPPIETEELPTDMNEISEPVEPVEPVEPGQPVEPAAPNLAAEPSPPPPASPPAGPGR
jgi:phospholipid/cholesterol/gamma-HCH transport system substrate-binding protein